MPQEDAAKGGNIRLKPAQKRVLAALAAAGEVELTRARYEQLAGVSRSQAAYDLAGLVGAGILQRIGSGRATRYRVRPDEPATQRRWTEERIWAELVQFCGERPSWPSAREFKVAGRGDLYVAASRYGGVTRWARALGVAHVPRSFPSQASDERRPSGLRSKLAWTGVGALAAIVLAGSAAVAVGLPRQSAPVPGAAKSSAGGGVADESLHPSPARRPTRPTADWRPVARSGRPRPKTRSVSVATSSIAQATPTSSSPTKSWLSSASTAPSGGPAPLAAPPATQAPAPIKAP